ncbi:MAG: GntR family transcriptional regulator [Granulosicoccus sp.]
MSRKSIETLDLANVSNSLKLSDQVKTGRVPLAMQISEMLIRDIQSGQLPNGERLPPERVMARQLRVSVGTLRKALEELNKLGLLHRVQGSGNYVHNNLDIDDVYALFRLELISGPAQPTASLISVRHIAKSSYVPHIGGSAKAFRFRRQRLLNAVEVALEEIWLDAGCAKSINPNDVPDSMYHFYQEHLGIRITRAEDRVSVASLPSWAPTSLRDRKCTHWGYIERLSRDQDGKPAEYSRTWFDPNLARFVSR